MKKLITILLLLSPLLAFSQLEGKWEYESDCGEGGLASAEWTITSQNRDGSFEGKMTGKNGEAIGTFIGTLKCNTVRIIHVKPNGERQVWTGFLNTRTKTMSGTFTAPNQEECSWTARKSSF